MDNGRAWAETAGPREQLDRAYTVLGHALFDLARLLVGVHVQDDLVLGRIAADLLEPVRRARADGVGGQPDGEPAVAQLLDPAEVIRRRALAKAVEPAARIGGVEKDERDAGRLGRLRGGERLVEAEVVELADGRVAGGAHLAVRALVIGTDAFRGLRIGLGEHRFAPGPEVAALGAAAERALKSVTVCVDEARDRQPLRHRSIKSVPPASSPI